MMAVIFLAALAALLATPFIGFKSVSPAEILSFSSSALDADVFWNIRVPRSLTAFLAGASLALSGLAFQSMFRNPLATPFTLGVSSGASMGAALYVRMGLSFSLLGIGGVSYFAFVGAGLSILLVYGLTRVKRGFSTATMLLAGVAVSFFFSSLILFMQYISDFTQSFRIVRWLMGELRVVGYDSVLNLLPFALVGWAAVLALGRELNLLTAGEEIAAGRGANVTLVKNVLFFASSLMVGGVVAICGPIGFVGMMAPHICRLLVGPDHKYLSMATLLFGGAFLTACDALARTLIAPAEIPVGVITAMLGGPFFVWLLVRGTVREEEAPI